MSSEPVIAFNSVWKKYSRHQVLNNSLRDELVSVITGKKCRAELANGEFWALKDISLTVGNGECIGLYGPNGSGKSTILKLISNVTYPTKGDITVHGRVAPLIELGAGMHPDLTGIENIYMNGAILGLTIREINHKQQEIIEFSGLEEFINAPVKKYSSGMYLRLAFSIAVHSPADIFLFDEVLAVGDEEFQSKCINKIESLRALYKTIVVVSHDIDSLENIADKVFYITRST
ncbi:MAG: ABC transporter ATP-binding protein [Desulfuromonadaceae bacterium]|nr:ABC transporter ATP-binding protein [Desulfuromonadaceae bacterium]MDD2847014.1 ABC transporter ATP-binding protein [Desulfuromonadaceae bacterium]MDD4129008.1 ABC transporter ATP-binding protein [Desulfuromonadaceae bacterium]